MGGRRPSPADRHHRPAVCVRPRAGRRAVQGSGPEPAVRLVVRADGRRHRQPRHRRCPTRTRCSPARPGRCRSRSSSAVTSPGSPTPRCGACTSRAHDRCTATTCPTVSAKNTPLPRHIVTPTTKAQSGGHDEPLSCAEVIERGLLERRSVGAGHVGGARALRSGRRARRRGRPDPRRHQVRVRADRRRRADPDRRGPHARLVALVGRRLLRASGSRPATSPRASTRRSSAGPSPTSATRATARSPRCPARCGRPPPADTSSRTND